MHVDTVIGSAGWALVEPVEGSFNFSLVDAQIAAAGARGMRLVLIWFGAFKNPASTYAPRWVRADTARFPRGGRGAVSREAFTYPGATPKPVLSVFSPELPSVADASLHLGGHITPAWLSSFAFCPITEIASSSSTQDWSTFAKVRGPGNRPPCPVARDPVIFGLSRVPISACSP
jgi:hypothetical protein